MLLEHRCDLEEKDVEGKTAAHWAVHSGDDTRCFEMLLGVREMPLFASSSVFCIDGDDKRSFEMLLGVRAFRSCELALCCSNIAGSCLPEQMPRFLGLFLCLDGC